MFLEMQTEVNNLNVKYINTNNESKEKYAHILKDVTLSVKHNSLNAIIGASGGGKTTFLNTLAGYVPKGSKTSGSIKINGKDRTYEDWRHNSILMDQYEFFNEDFTIYTECQRVLQLETDLSKKEIDAKIDKILERLGILDNKNQLLETLSGGQKKRADIAVALLSNRQYIFLDEPNSGLDDMTAFNTIKYLKELCEKEGKTVLITIHQPAAEIAGLIDNLVCISSGQVFYNGKVHDCIPYMESYGILNTKKRTPTFFLIETTASVDQETQEKLKKMCQDYKEKNIDNYKETKEVTKNYSVNDYKINFRTVKTLYRGYLTRETNFLATIINTIFLIAIFAATGYVSYSIIKETAPTKMSGWHALFVLSLSTIFSTVTLFETHFYDNRVFYQLDIYKGYYNWPTLLTAWTGFILSFSSIVYSLLLLMHIITRYSARITFLPLSFILSVPIMTPYFMVYIFLYERWLKGPTIIILSLKLFDISIWYYIAVGFFMFVDTVFGKNTFKQETANQIPKYFYLFESFFSPTDIVRILEDKYNIWSYGLKEFIKQNSDYLCNSFTNKDKTEAILKNLAVFLKEKGDKNVEVSKVEMLIRRILYSGDPKMDIYGFINSTPILIVRLLIGMTVSVYIVYWYFKSKHSKNFRFITGKK